jgi:hypothetical protein
LAYAPVIPYPVHAELFAAFGLAGQPRGGKPLKEILFDAGITAGSRVGVVGWKPFSAEDFADPSRVFDIPHYIAEDLFGLAGRENVANATDLFMDNDRGLRITLDAKEIVLAEIAAAKSSRAVYHCLKNLTPGASEVDASAALCLDGEPLACYPNVNFGVTNVGYGVAGPTRHTFLKDGDPVSIGAAYRRALCHRSQLFAGSENELPSGSLESFFKPYFHSIVNWYGAVRVGAACGDVYAAAQEPLGSYKEFGVGLNPGHMIHTDEWPNSPFTEGSATVLKSGMLIQCDYMAVHKEAGLFAHAEDGIALADAALRAEIKDLSPAAWSRIERRRTFLADILGIKLHEDVLPLSDIPGMFFIYGKDVSFVLAAES